MRAFHHSVVSSVLTGLPGKWGLSGPESHGARMRQHLIKKIIMTVRVFAGLIAFALPIIVQLRAVGLERQELQVTLDKALDSDGTARRTTVALKIIDLATSETLYDRQGDRLFTPASNLKIYTSSCALDLFGPDHRFPTQISARVDEKTGIVSGNLQLVGGGNAMLSSNELGEIADRIVAEWGVRALRGVVFIDNSRYSNIRLGPGWMWDDEPYYYNMQITPLMVDFNVLKVRAFAKVDGLVGAQLDPVSRYPLLRVVVEKERGAAWRVVRRPTDDDIIVLGEGEFADPIEERFAMKDPRSWVASMFTEMLRARGVKIEPSPHETDEGSSAAERKFVFSGSKLSATLKHFHHESENAVGEVLLHEIAIAKGKLRPSWPDGAKCITSWLHDSAGLEQGSFKLVDGSGLSRYNLISADSSVKLLAFMRRHQHYQTFIDSLLAYKVETGAGEMQELVHAKSGGMSGVSTISGYVKTLEGRQLVFSLLSNGFIGSSKPVQALRRKVWRVLVQYQAEAGN